MTETALFISHLCFPFFPSLFAVRQKQQRSSHHAIIITTICMALSRGTEFLPGTWYSSYGLCLPVPVGPYLVPGILGVIYP